MDNPSISRGSAFRRSIPLNTDDPNQVASLLLGLGYDHENIADALITRCGVEDQATAAQIIAVTLTRGAA